jgi:phosphatidylinositol 3-kinase
MVQFVDSLPVASVLEEHNSIQAYFRKHRPDPSAPYGIKPEVMDTYVRSCGA